YQRKEEVGLGLSEERWREGMRTGVTSRRGRSASNYYDLVTLKLSRDELEGHDSHVCQPAACQLTFISDGLIKHRATERLQLSIDLTAGIFRSSQGEIVYHACVGEPEDEDARFGEIQQLFRRVSFGITLEQVMPCHSAVISVDYPCLLL
ncbi:hypothetical protein CRENBAI_010712, partial [Crenichthys baileyi]